MAYRGEYALFSGEFYYPSGGWKDHRLTDSLEACKTFQLNPDYQWAHIVHLPTGMMILQKRATIGIEGAPWETVK